MHRHLPWRPKAVGIDITSNVNFRMVTPEERAMFAAGGEVLPDHIEETIAARLPVSVRDEAIWQYHLRRKRGIVLWHADQTFRYVPEGSSIRIGDDDASIADLLRGYEPTTEALLWADGIDFIEILRIGADGGSALCRKITPPSQPGVVSGSGNAS